MQYELDRVAEMPVRDEDASDIFSELVPQVLRNTEERNEVTNRLVRSVGGCQRCAVGQETIAPRTYAVCMSFAGA